ncbi:hypothetical protein B0J11DRAFT_435005 [Dendryphion nanum]|uniref:Uncharacterized protein n=1 Tax=Dendryphion nanum TaxID=256645 RepID=A0A9P9IN70_9PLEO|nr:hypothetical protein B0J11DRAFT_435005 [Dendryphion nanum]
MDPSRSSRSTRRSYPNLHNLSLAPLSSAYPLDASQPPSPSSAQAVQTPMTSYIAQKSAPTTPGILSLSQSRNSSRNRDPQRQRRRSKPYIYDSYFLTASTDGPVRDIGDIPKAKSTSSMLPGVSFADEKDAGTPGRHHRRKGTAPLPLRAPLVRHHTSEAQDEWFHRAGLAIAGETRESKGQSWLIRRDSSTSLVGDTSDDHTHHDTRSMALLSGEHLSDLEYSSPFTPRLSRAGSRIHSRVGSRVPSARTSRRGSRVGSRADLHMSVGGVRTPSARQSLELDERAFEEHTGPDFIDDESESDGDEEEVARLARERGLGLGGWMDRLIGWTLFSVDEDGESSDDDDEGIEEDGFRPENMTREEARLRREIELRRRKLEREAIIAASAVGGVEEGGEKREKENGNETGVEKAPSAEEAGSWQDAAWLFSVASKVIL